MGGYITKEIPGPGSFDQWRASFRVYRTAMLMLDILTMTTCVAYEAHVEKLDRLYPGAWHLIVAADDLGRSEHLVRLRVSVNLDIANGTKEPMGWAVESAWECLFRMLVKDSSFWAEQVHVPANAWLAHGSKGKPLTPAEAVAAASIQGGINAIKPDTESMAGTPSSARRTRNVRRREAKRKQAEADGPTDAKKNKGDGKGKGKGKEKPQAHYAWNNNNGAGPVLAYHQVPPAKEGCQGRTSASSAAQWDTRHVNALRKTVDCPASDGLVLQDLHNKTRAGRGSRRQQDFVVPTTLDVGRFKLWPSGRRKAKQSQWRERQGRRKEVEIQEVSKATQRRQGRVQRKAHDVGLLPDETQVLLPAPLLRSPWPLGHHVGEPCKEVQDEGHGGKLWPWKWRSRSTGRSTLCKAPPTSPWG